MNIDFVYPDSVEQTDEWLYELCTSNKQLRIERDELGQIIVMSPTGGTSSNQLFKVLIYFMEWAAAHEHEGLGFESSAGFLLPNGAMRAPDAAWVSKERWDKLTDKQKEKFPPLVPDFVIEVRSHSDSLKALKQKMTEWISNGCQLAWLIDPLEKKAYTYDMHGHTEEITSFDSDLVATTVVPGLTIPLKKLKV